MIFPEYDPNVFYQDHITASKFVILTPENGLSSEERWQQETPWVIPKLSFDDGIVVDYGCGIGRIARELTSNPVLGVDISSPMRHQADGYVDRWDFGAVNPVMFHHIVRSGFRARGALSIWVLQHTIDPLSDISLLKSSMLPGSKLYVLNRLHRAIPVRIDGRFAWIDDGIDVLSALRQEFYEESYEENPSKLMMDGAFFGTYIRV